MFFLAADLSNAKPVPVKDCKEWVLDVALTQYSNGDRHQKVQEKGEVETTKELTQM